MIIAYLPVTVRDRLRQAAHAADTSYTALVLEALDETHAQLGQAFGGSSGAAGSSLFTGRSRAGRRRHTEPQVQVSLRPLKTDLDTIDRLVEELGAPDRSALIAAALDRHLI